MPGIELSRLLYEEAVGPILAQAYPDLRYAAARLGSGSEVLGFDTPRSADHEWGPRVDLFVAADRVPVLSKRICELLSQRLPKQIRGWPTNFQESTDPLDPVGRMQPTSGPVNHRVCVHDVGAWLEHRLGLKEGRAPTTLDWLAMPQQRLAEVTTGAVFRDDLGELAAARSMLAWYPDQVWRYLLRCQWQRISQEEAFIGRTAEVGDDLGSRIITARLVRDVMRLAFLLAGRYAPYNKWLGSDFATLPAAGTLGPHLRQATTATDRTTRERELAAALEIAGQLHNDAGVTEPVDPTPRSYHGRPYLVLHAERFAEALRLTITDAGLRQLPPTGSVDQWADNTDLLHQPAAIRAAIRAIMTSQGA